MALFLLFFSSDPLRRVSRQKFVFWDMNVEGEDRKMPPHMSPALAQSTRVSWQTPAVVLLIITNWCQQWQIHTGVCMPINMGRWSGQAPAIFGISSALVPAVPGYPSSNATWYKFTLLTAVLQPQSCWYMWQFLSAWWWGFIWLITSLFPQSSKTTSAPDCPLAVLCWVAELHCYLTMSLNTGKFTKLLFTSLFSLSLHCCFWHSQLFIIEDVLLPSTVVNAISRFLLNSK